ncbi:MAG: N-glycosylase/DNA lyase [Desulfurococcus sp.]|nr:N-glycosylase/DNA lyase [Desulfurococcus sp.]
MLKVDYSRACDIGVMIKGFKQEISLLKHLDPQFKAVELLLKSKGAGKTAVLVVANSLVSYQLNVKGEVYWQAFAEYHARRRYVDLEGVFKGILEFMVSTGFNTRLLEQKKNRLARFLASRLARDLEENGLVFCRDLKRLSKALADLYRGGYSKTTAFAVKIYAYLCEAAGMEPCVEGLQPPLDLRNAILLCTSCIVRRQGSLGECVEAVTTKLKESSIKALEKLCECSGLDCVSLDVFTWLVTGVLRDTGFNPRESNRLIKERFGLDISVNLLEELTRCSGG